MKKNVFIITFIFSCWFAKAQTFYNDSIINVALQNTNVDSITKIIQDLQDMETRFMISETRYDVVDYLENRFHEIGIDSIQIDSFQCHTMHPGGLDTVTWQYNVIAVITGNELADEVVIVGGHYDSFSTDSNPMILAPGADDNASGTAVCLETARILSEINFQPQRTIEIVCFAGEEFMLSGTSGSEHYAYEAATNGKNIRLMINNDMVGYDDGNWTICLSNYPECSAETNMMSQIVSDYTSLNLALWPSSWPPFADVEPFMDNGYKSVYVEESFFNPFYHTSNDLLENISAEYCTEVSKISLAAILYNDLTIGIEDGCIALEEHISIYPNPASNYLNIACSKNQKFDFLIFNQNSQLLKSGKSDFNKNISVSDLCSGYYLIRIRTKDFVKTYSFIKQ